MQQVVVVYKYCRTNRFQQPMRMSWPRDDAEAIVVVGGGIAMMQEEIVRGKCESSAEPKACTSPSAIPLCLTLSPCMCRGGAETSAVCITTAKQK